MAKREKDTEHRALKPEDNYLETGSYFLLAAINITSAFSINKVQVRSTFTFVRGASVNTNLKLIRAVVQVFINTLVYICMTKTLDNQFI